MFGLPPADFLTLALYLLGVTVVGILAVRKVSGTADFIMPRRFGKFMMMMHGFGTATHSAHQSGAESMILQVWHHVEATNDRTLPETQYFSMRMGRARTRVP